MRVGEWVREGMPFDVPFVITRFVPTSMFGDLETTIKVGVRVVVLAVEHYQERCGGEAEYMLLDDPLKELQPYQHVYVAYHRRMVQAGAKVCMRRKDE